MRVPRQLRRNEHSVNDEKPEVDPTADAPAIGVSGRLAATFQSHALTPLLAIVAISP